MAVCKECEHYNACLIHWSESVLRNIGICEHFKSGWISVRDRLPKKHEEVLACTDDGCMDVLWLGDAMGVLFWEDNNFVCYPKDYVAYWMPLPEPPKEEAE